jgi:hypothetical protein
MTTSLIYFYCRLIEIFHHLGVMLAERSRASSRLPLPGHWRFKCLHCTSFIWTRRITKWQNNIRGKTITEQKEHLFGPLKTTDTSKKNILAMTDAFTKYVELVAIPDNDALTVTSAIFSRWICRHGLPWN